MPSSAQPPHAAQNPRIWLRFSGTSLESCALTVAMDMGGGTISLLCMRLEIGADKEVYGHGGADDDDERANPTLRQSLRIMRREIATDDGAKGHDRGLLPRDCSGGNKGERSHAIDDAAEHDFERVHGVHVRHANSREHGQRHDANAAAEIAAIDRHDKLEHAWTSHGG